MKKIRSVNFRWIKIQIVKNIQKVSKKSDCNNVFELQVGKVDCCKKYIYKASKTILLKKVICKNKMTKKKNQVMKMSHVWNSGCKALKFQAVKNVKRKL